MTQKHITQAQIEAAAKAIKDECNLGSDLPVFLAKAALTAAAQVGEPYAGMQRDATGLVLKYTDKDLRDTETATIERCAQVADAEAEALAGIEHTFVRRVAAAIRKLKDEP